MPVSGRVRVGNHSYENDFDWHENETVCRTLSYRKGFAPRFVLKQRHTRTRKWPIDDKYLCTLDTNDPR